MLRVVLFLLISIVLITFLRMVMGLIINTMKAMMSPGIPPTGSPPASPATGELKRDPVCGTFIPASTSFRKTVNGEAHCFCSAECRDKYGV
jgi:YHS domain-containing protein